MRVRKYMDLYHALSHESVIRLDDSVLGQPSLQHLQHLIRARSTHNVSAVEKLEMPAHINRDSIKV